VDLVLRRFGIRPARLVRLRAVELALTCLAALAVLVLPFSLVMLLLPRLIEPGPMLSPALGPQVPLMPLLLSMLAAVVVTAVAVWAAARRSATLRPSEVLRDDQ
jgi:ABC-type lipoprotein release transport system permease subunit